MENKIGYAVITTQEYKELIEKEKENELYMTELEETISKQDIIKEKLEKYFFDRLLDAESYHLENIKEFVPNEYNYQKLYQKFLDIGIDDAQYIHTSIMILKHNFDDANNKKVEKVEE